MAIVPLNKQPSMPQISAAFANWTIPIYLKVITQSIVNGFVVNSERSVNVRGVWQPLTPEQIMLKPEGQRSWEWVDFHVEGKSVVFATNDRVLKDGLLYKIMALNNYSFSNFTEYHLIRDYEEYEAPVIEPIYVTYLGENVTYLSQNVTYNPDYYPEN